MVSLGADARQRNAAMRLCQPEGGMLSVAHDLSGGCSK